MSAPVKYRNEISDENAEALRGLVRSVGVLLYLLRDESLTRDARAAWLECVAAFGDLDGQH